jgi:hypothetical protein
MNSKPITLRAHHVQAAKLANKTSEEVFTEIGLIRLGYIDTSDHPFKKIAYDGLKKLFENPNNEIRVTVGGLDRLCNACPRREEGKCNPENPRTGLARMSLEFYETSQADEEIIEKYELQKDQVYTVKELREKLKF